MANPSSLPREGGRVKRSHWQVESPDDEICQPLTSQAIGGAVAGRRTKVSNGQTACHILDPVLKAGGSVPRAYYMSTDGDLRSTIRQGHRPLPSEVRTESTVRQGWCCRLQIFGHPIRLGRTTFAALRGYAETFAEQVNCQPSGR
jgi:hypothetical protein